MRAWLKGIACFNELANDVQLLVPGNGVSFHELVPFHVEALQTHALDLLANSGKGNELVLIAVCHEEPLLFGEGRQMLEEMVFILDVAADSYQASEPMRV